MSDNKKTIEGVFTSVWDYGHEISSKCSINLETGSVFNIELAEEEDVCSLEEEFVTVFGIDFDIHHKFDNEYLISSPEFFSLASATLLKSDFSSDEKEQRTSLGL